MTPAAYIPSVAPSRVLTPSVSLRRSGILMLALGGLALLIGLLILLTSFAGDSAFKTEDIGRLMSQLQISSADQLRLLLRLMAGVFIVYSICSLTLGLLLRLGRPVWVVVAITFAGLAAFFFFASAMLSLFGGTIGDFVLPILLCGLHAMIAKWLITALRERQAASSAAPAPSPMAAYYATLPVSPAVPH